MPDLTIARAALSLVLPRRSATAPGVVLETRGIRADAARLAAYAEVCGFGRADAALPITYPHVLGFRLGMRLMTRRDFPFPLPGLVHVRDVIMQARPLLAGEELDISVRAEGPMPHPRGATIDVVTEVRVATEPVWTERSTYLRRVRRRAPRRVDGEPREAAARDGIDGAVVDQWPAAANVGRRYARVSGDRNPIHLRPWAARLFGFRRPIAHGMWTAARALAGLGDRLPTACTVDVRFQAPVYLPAELQLLVSDDAARFAVISPGARPRPHVTGVVLT